MTRSVPSAQRHTAHLLQWALLSALPVALTLQAQPLLYGFWQEVITRWSALLGLSLSGTTQAHHTRLLWAVAEDGTRVPSSQTLWLTSAGLLLLWAVAGQFSDRFHPLRVGLRALCLIQASACAFFWWSPASFPYTLTRHAHTLLDMGYGFMLATGPMLALGWGILQVPLWSKLVAPVGVLAYFSLMLPHQALLHTWLLTHGSVLFMPVLFLCFGVLLDWWIFVALYAWLASQAPASALSAKVST